jgi:mono/diheme cytochrome c family protein
MIGLVSVAALGKQDPAGQIMEASSRSVGRGAVAPVQEPDAKSLYGQHCIACHGQAGAGDGPLANAIKPRPASFAASAFQATRSDPQLAAAITAGKPPMPAFGKLLSPAQVKALVAYIRLLGRSAK